MSTLKTEPYSIQVARWPTEGRHIMAQFDDDTIVVYQAYRPEIGHFAAQHGYFGGAFKLTRMSWIKPNFLWMMYRCGWATKEGQEVVLAIRLQRTAFDKILAEAVHSSFVRPIYGTKEEWSAAVAASNVRLQFDPDHNPSGHPVARRAIQLGLRGEALRKYSRNWIIDIEDISEFVRAQHRHVEAREVDQLQTPTEEVYRVDDETVRNRLRLDSVA